MKRTGLLIMAVLAVVVAACGGGGETVADGGEVTITMTEYQFEPSEIHLAVGTTVTFVLRNDGEKDHELMAGQEVHMEDGIPHGFETDFFDTVENLTIDPPDAQEMEMEGMGDMSSDTTMGDMGSDTTMGDMGSDTTMGDMGGEEMDMGVMVVREPTQTARITFTVTEASVGEWEFGCFEEDGAHWDDGMKGKIIVEEA
jgi:plastocyanin